MENKNVLKNVEVLKEELEDVRGGNKFEIPKGQTRPNICPYCWSEYIAEYAAGKWICGVCGAIMKQLDRSE